MGTTFQVSSTHFIAEAGRLAETKKRPFRLPQSTFQNQSWRGLKQTLVQRNRLNGETTETTPYLCGGFVVQLDESGNPVQVSKVDQVVGGDMVKPLKIVYHWTSVYIAELDKWVRFDNGSINLPDAKKGQMCFELIERDFLVKYTPYNPYDGYPFQEKPFYGWTTIQCLQFEFHGRTHLYLFSLPAKWEAGWGWQYILNCRIASDCEYDSGLEGCTDCVIHYD